MVAVVAVIVCTCHVGFFVSHHCLPLSSSQLDSPNLSSPCIPFSSFNGQVSLLSQTSFNSLTPLLCTLTPCLLPPPQSTPLLFYLTPLTPLLLYLTPPEWCKELRNYNSVFHIVSGLNHGLVQRQRATWEKIPHKHKRVMEVRALHTHTHTYSITHTHTHTQHCIHNITHTAYGV